MSYYKFKVKKELLPRTIANIYNGYSSRQQYKSIQFPGYLPISYVDVDNMLTATNYLASRKQSGIRFFSIYQVEDKCMFLFDKAGNIYRFPVVCSRSFVCDLEWCEDSSKIYVLDCVSNNGDEKTRFIPSRYRGIKDVVGDLVVEDFEVVSQTFYAVEHAINLYHANEKDDPWEGIVFTPKDHQYFGTHNPIIKWKPAKQETFDFKVLEVSDIYGTTKGVSRVVSEGCESSAVNPQDIEEGGMIPLVGVQDSDVTYFDTTAGRLCKNYRVMYAKIEDSLGEVYNIRVRADYRLIGSVGSVCEFKWWEETDCEWFVFVFARSDVAHPNPMSRFLRWHKNNCGLYEIGVKMKLSRISMRGTVDAPD